MSWGHVTSKDLLTWKYAPVHTVLKPDKKYDREGVFTGCLGLITHKNELSIFYTSIVRLPFHWISPATRGSAGLALATSADDGLTWTKSKSNPVLAEEPEGLEVTGFRDPYLAEWPALDDLRGMKSLYGLISGGIQGVGPTSFLYAVNPQYIKQWDYLGPLIDMPPRWQPSEKWNCNYGVNWECVNFMTLQAGSLSQDFLILGSEGDVAREHLRGKNLPPNIPPRTVRAQQWMACNLVGTENRVAVTYKYGGILDHGPYYAANSFADPVSGRRIVYGWIPEEDCPSDFAHYKGWNGCQAFPRELFLLRTPNVVGALRSPLEDITSEERILQPDRSVTLHTMGVRPIQELEQLCMKAKSSWRMDGADLIPFTLGIYTNPVTSTRYPTWCIQSKITIDPLKCSRVGFHIRHNTDLSERTTISFSMLDELISIDRSCSGPPRSDFNCCEETGPFTLYNIKAPGDATETLEQLDLQILSDGDVLEIFVNERFALETMVYSGDPERNGGITMFMEGEEGGAIFDRTWVWDGPNGGETCIVYQGEDEDGDK